jgi:ABC-type transporter Mla maintaining outer membrane lipid asymmetry ATPase subunit MlaF
LNALTVAPGDRAALAGFDAVATEVLTNLITGATLPDEGEVRVFGVPTSAIEDEQAWLASLDRFGILSTRAVLLSSSTIAQNLAMPFTLSIDPMPPEVRVRVEALAAHAGLNGALDRLAGEASPELQVRVHLARAIALDPDLLLLEHPTAGLSAGEVRALARDVRAMAESRGLAVLAVTEDAEFAKVVADRRWVLDAASGALHARGWRRWLRG